MSGGGAQQAPSTTPKWMLPYIKDLASSAQSQYQNYTPQYYPGSTVAPQSGETLSAIGDLGGFGQSGYNQGILQGGAQANQTLQSASDPNANPVLGAGLATAPGNLAFLQAVQQRAQSGMPGVTPGAAGAYANNLDPTGTLNRLQEQATPLNVTNPQTAPTGIEGLAGATQGNTAGALNSFLTGEPGRNPYIDQMVNRALQANTLNFNQGVMPQISNASQIEGGYGGTRQGVAQGVATQGLNTANANMAGQLYSQQYNQDLQNQLNAAQLGSNVAAQGSQTELARIGQGQNYGLNLAQLQSGNTQADLARQLSAAGQAGQIGLGSGQLGLGAQTAGQQFLQNAMSQGLDASQMGLGLLTQGYGQGQDSATKSLAFLPALQQMGLTGINAQGQAGATQDAYQQQQLSDLVNRWNFQQNLPYEQLNQYASLLGGATQGAGTAQPQTSSGGLAGALGGASSAAGVLGMLGQAGMTIPGPVGWGMMGLSALGGLFG